jgi:GNAT superfamily N-acetyltransferase
MPSLALITSLNDDLLLPWLDLYESAFPWAERVPVSLLLGYLKEKDPTVQMLAALDEEEGFAGLAVYALNEKTAGRTAYLWYLATLPELRGQGLGAWIYRGILARLTRQRQPHGVEALFFDVEMPAQAQTEEEKLLALRRIRFYQRLGARLLSGVRYTPQVTEQRPRLEMHLMVHPLADLSPQEACELAQILAPEWIERTGEVGYA